MDGCYHYTCRGCICLYLVWRSETLSDILCFSEEWGWIYPERPQKLNGYCAFCVEITFFFNPKVDAEGLFYCPSHLSSHLTLDAERLPFMGSGNVWTLFLLSCWFGQQEASARVKKAFVPFHSKLAQEWWPNPRMQAFLDASWLPDTAPMTSPLGLLTTMAPCFCAR